AASTLPMRSRSRSTKRGGSSVSTALPETGVDISTRDRAAASRVLRLGIALQQLLHRFARRDAAIHHPAYRARDRHLDADLACQAVDGARGVNAFRDMAQLAQHRVELDATRQSQPDVTVP